MVRRRSGILGWPCPILERKVVFLRRMSDLGEASGIWWEEMGYFRRQFSVVWEKVSYCLETSSILRGECPVWGKKVVICREEKWDFVGDSVLFSGDEGLFGDTISSLLQTSCILAMRRHTLGRTGIFGGENVTVLEKSDTQSNSPAFCVCTPQAPGLLLLAPASSLPSQLWHNKRPSFCSSTQKASSLLHLKPASLLPSAFRHTKNSPF